MTPGPGIEPGTHWWKASALTTAPTLLPDARSAPILHALKWNSLADRRAKQLKSLMFKTVNNLVPEYLSDKFASVNTIHRHNLRGAQHNLFIPRPNTEVLKKSFRYRGAVTWNSLSAEAKQATTLNSFYSAIVH